MTLEVFKLLTTSLMGNQNQILLLKKEQRGEEEVTSRSPNSFLKRLERFHRLYRYPGNTVLNL